MPPAKLGLVYSHTGLRRFLNAIGEPRTRELFLLGRHVDAHTALTWGLVNWIVPDEDLERELIALRAACFTSDDLLEGVSAFAQKRTPRWTGR